MKLYAKYLYPNAGTEDSRDTCKLYETKGQLTQEGWYKVTGLNYYPDKPAYISLEDFSLNLDSDHFEFFDEKYELVDIYYLASIILKREINK